MPRASISKFTVFFLATIIASFAQLNMKAVFGWSPEFILAALVVSGFYLNILETATLVAVSILILNWRPTPGLEIFLFLILPFAVILARKFSPWKSEINGVLGIVLSVVVFYAFSNLSAIFLNPIIFAEIIALTALFGAILFQIFNYFYKISPA